MPDTPLKSQASDLAFHPHKDVLFAAFLDGQIRCYSYDDEGLTTLQWKVRPSKKSCRALDVRTDGLHLWAGTKSGSIYTVDTETGKVLGKAAQAHGAAISRIATLGESMNMFSSGDDDGVVKIWDTRSPSSGPTILRTYNHHTDYISDFAWLTDKKHLVVTSGDGTLSVINVRSNKTTPVAQSEGQEDELLSVVPIKGGTKIVVGTQLGPLTIFDRAKGYGDCVDRFIGHPSSVETMVSLSSSHITQDVIATGASDGLIRVVQIHPSKFLGVIAAHGISPSEVHKDDVGERDTSSIGGFPIERIKLDRRGKWLGSISHDEIIKLTDMEGALEGSGDESDGQAEDSRPAGSPEDDTDQENEHGAETEEHTQTHDRNEGNGNAEACRSEKKEQAATMDGSIVQQSDSEASLPVASSDVKKSKKRRRKELKREEKRRKQGGAMNSFFADL